MKITIKRNISVKSTGFDVKSFIKKADQVFLNEVRPQIERAKNTTTPKLGPNCNNHV